MREIHVRALIAALMGLAGCAHATHFRPALPEQSVPGQQEEAAAQSAGVRMIVHAGDWQGRPSDLEDRLTPVEVYIENGSGRALRVAPEHFGLTAPNGFRYQALDPLEVGRLAGPLYRGEPAFYFGLYGAYPWPGVLGPWHHPFYPFAWWGWSMGPYGAPVAPEGTEPRPSPRGTLQAGGSVSILLFFPVPARSLERLDLTADLVDQGGQRFGGLRIPLVRGEASASASQQPPEQQPPPASAQPPTPAPSRPPPAPPQQPPPPPAQAPAREAQPPPAQEPPAPGPPSPFQ